MASVFRGLYGLILLNHFIRHAGAPDPLSWRAFTFFCRQLVHLRIWLDSRLSGQSHVEPFGRRAGLERGFGGTKSALQLFVLSRNFPEKCCTLYRIALYIAVPLVALFGRRFGLKGRLRRPHHRLVWPGDLVCLERVAWFQQPVDEQLRSVSVFLRRHLAFPGVRGRVPPWNPVFRLTGILGGIVCLFAASVCFGVQADTPNSTVIGAPIGWALVLTGTVLFFLSFPGAPERFLPKPVVSLGRISYGLYLFHELAHYLIFHVWKPWLLRLSEWAHLRPTGPVSERRSPSALRSCWRTCHIRFTSGRSFGAKAGSPSFRPGIRQWPRLKRTSVAAKTNGFGKEGWASN
jgi:hypothetical protein